MKNYTLLDKSATYNKKAVEQLAEAMNELVELEERQSYLKDLIAENSELYKFVWQTAEKKNIAFHDIEEEHFANILTHLRDTGRPYSREIQAEAKRRKVKLPANLAFLLSISDERPRAYKLKK